MSYKVEDIANKILFEATDEEGGDLICNMKLQKMLYYMQGFYLAYFDKPFFKEEVEAWMYGPVVPTIYDKYKKHEKKGISYNGEVITLINKEEGGLFDEVYHVYNQYSAIGLMDRTHSEKPWKSTPVGVGSVIKKDIMKKFFKVKLKKSQ